MRRKINTDLAIIRYTVENKQAAALKIRTSKEGVARFQRLDG